MAARSCNRGCRAAHRQQDRFPASFRMLQTNPLVTQIQHVSRSKMIAPQRPGLVLQRRGRWEFRGIDAPLPPSLHRRWKEREVNAGGQCFCLEDSQNAIVRDTCVRNNCQFLRIGLFSRAGPRLSLWLHSTTIENAAAPRASAAPSPAPERGLGARCPSAWRGVELGK
eukprot:gene18651-biopygen23434